MTRNQAEIEGVLDTVETAYFVTEMLAGCNGKIAVNAYNAAVDEFNAAVNRYYAIGAANDDNGKRALYQTKITAEVTARSIIDQAVDLKGIRRGITRGEFVYTPQHRYNTASIEVDNTETIDFDMLFSNYTVKPNVDKVSSVDFELTIEDMPKPRKCKPKSDDKQLSIDFNAWRQCALDFDLQAASVNAVEKTALIGRFINAVNAVKAGKQAASVNAVEKTALIGRLINAVNAVKAGKQTSSVNAVKTEIAPFVIDYRKRQEKYRKQREAAKRRKNAPVEISTAIEEYETVEPILITGNTAEDAARICALNKLLDDIEWHSFYTEVFKREIFEGGDLDIREQDRDTHDVCQKTWFASEDEYLELAKVYYRGNEANENVLDKALTEACACGTNNAVMIKREKGRKFYIFRDAARRTDKYTLNRTMKLRMA